jgi:hypothetical protein
LAIGREAGPLLDRLGLYIRGDGRVMKGDHHSFRWVNEDSDHAVSEVAALQDQTTFVHTVFLPTETKLTKLIDVVARYGDRPEYVAIARQHNAAFCGVGCDLRGWSEDFMCSFRKLVAALLQAAVVAGEPALPAPDKPGRFDVRLGRHGEPNGSYQRSFCFKFDAPITVRAKFVPVEGTYSMMLLRGETTHAYSMRSDSRNGTPLALTAHLTKSRLRENEDRLWVLEIVNFDSDTEASGVLTVRCW